MKFKFDENLDARLGLKLTGHDVASVTSQKPGGRPDEVIAKVCASEGRILVTLDLDFSNPLRFPPGNMCGIIILRPKRTLFPLIEKLVDELAVWLASRNPEGKLWVVEPGRLRIFMDSKSS